MARHEVVIHQNTGALSEVAPYTGSYISKETVAESAFAEAVAKSGKGCFVFDPERELRPDARQRQLTAWLRNLPRPCGIFAANDYVGEEIINICGQLGISVPNDIAVLGVDNDEQICERLVPTLSSIAPTCASMSSSRRNWQRARARLSSGFSMWKYTSPSR